jgi:dTDP-4-amino-4,6-dideoxygalactose transaminase
MQIPFVDLKTQYESLKPEMDQAILAVCGRGDYVLGQAVTDFESAFARYCHAKHAVGVASGLDALILALKAFDIGQDTVITAVNSFVATSLAVGGRSKAGFCGVIPRPTRLIRRRWKLLLPLRHAL